MNDLIHDHSEALHEAVSNWPEGEALNPNDEKSQALAFEILQHAALLHRYTADDGVLNYLFDLPVDERRNLTIAGLRYLDTGSLAARLTSLEDSDFDEGDLVIVEEALITRDTLGAAVDLGIQLAPVSMWVQNDQPDFELLRAMGHAQGELDLLDDAFRVIRPATLVSMQVLEGLKAAIRTPIDSSWWWFEDGEAILQAEDDAFMAHLFPKVAKQPEEVLAANIIQFLKGPSMEEMQFLAAADGGETFEVSLNPGQERFHLAVALVETGANFLLRDKHGAPPAWAGSARLVMDTEEGATKVYPFDDNGLLLVSHKEIAGVTRIQLKDNGGEIIWQEG